MGSIYISNKMTSKYFLSAKRESTIMVEVTSGRYENETQQLEITPRVYRTSKREVEFDVKYANYSITELEVQPYIGSKLEIEVEVNPHNKMSAKYNLRDAPTVTITETPTQDAYTIQKAPYSSINYGNVNSMIVGNNDNGENIGFIKYDLSNINPKIRLKRAVLRVYYDAMTDGIDIETYTANEDWREYNITYLNQPETKDLINNQYIVNKEKRYIEIEVTDTVVGWVKGLENLGFVLKSPDVGVALFRTREFGLPAELEIEYYSDENFSSSRSRQSLEVICQRRDNSTIEIEFDVHATFTKSTREVEVTCHNINDIISSTIPVEVSYIKNQQEIIVNVTHAGKSTALVEVSCGIPSIRRQELEVEVPFFENDSTIELEVTPAFLDNSERELEVTAFRNLKTGNSTIELEVDVLSKYITGHSVLEVEIDVYRNLKDGNSAVELEVNSRHTEIGNSTQEVVVYVSRGHNMQVEVAVPYDGFNTQEVEVRARILTVSLQEVEVDVNGKQKKSYSFVYII